MTLTELQTAHPYGAFSERFGCYFTVDYDSELGYFRQLIDGSFESDWNFVDFDTLGEDVAEEIESIATTIIRNI